MQLLVIVLNRTEKLEDLLASFSDHGIMGATIIDSTGMAKVMGEVGEHRILASLYELLNPERAKSKTIFAVIEEDKLQAAKTAVKEVLGGFDAPNTGILFTLPVSYAEGLRKKDE